MIMIVGLPGAGKTTWGINMQKNHPEKRYNIIGTDTLIEKIRVMGLPRRNNYHGRWEVLIGKATQCLNKLFNIGTVIVINIYYSSEDHKVHYSQVIVQRFRDMGKCEFWDNSNILLKDIFFQREIFFFLRILCKDYFLCK